MADYSFDYFFKYHSYTLQDGTIGDFSDTLAISISDDCGETWIEFWEKAHDELATAEPHFNITDFNVLLALPEANEWKTEKLDLMQVADELELDKENVQIKFTYRSGQGGTFYMDNVRFGTPASVFSQAKKFENIYPLPASDLINFSVEIERSDLYTITVSDLSGRNLIERFAQLSKGINNLSQELNNFMPGTYFINIEGSDSRYSSKFMVE